MLFRSRISGVGTRLGEALQAFPKVGQCIADSVTLEEWNGSAEEHAKYLAENGNWWTDTTFIIGDEK